MSKTKAIEQYKELITIFLNTAKRDFKYDDFKFTTDFEKKSYSLLMLYAKLNAYSVLYTNNGNKINFVNEKDNEVVANVLKSVFLVANVFGISIPELILSKRQADAEVFTLIVYFLVQYRIDKNKTDYISKVLESILYTIMPKPEARLGFLRVYTFRFEDLNSTF